MILSCANARRFGIASVVLLACVASNFWPASSHAGVAVVETEMLQADVLAGKLPPAANRIPNTPLVGQNMPAPGSNGGDDGSIITHIHAKDHDPSLAPFNFPEGILAAIPKAPPAGQNVSALSPNDASITFVCCSYNPTVVTITVGASVSWSGSFAFPHPLRQVDGPTSDVPVPGGFANSTGTFYSVPFNAPGTYYYQCANHGLAQFGGTMRGRIVVLFPPVFLPLVIK